MVASLKRWFPTKDLGGVAVQWARPQMKHGATSHRLRPEGLPSNPMMGLARAMIAEALDGADGTPSDLVLVVDDLELHNIDQPEVVCVHFRSAVETELSRRFHRLGTLVGEQQDARASVQARCGFHLISPMVESYLFGEHAALVRAGCATTVSPQVATPDWEQFESTDPPFLVSSNARNAEMAATPLFNTWWREEHHAKHYLEHLVNQCDGFYDETVGGVAAFEALEWPEVVAPPDVCPLIRALFGDLADFFGIFSRLPSGIRSPHTYSGPPRPGSRQLLRNM